MKSLSVLLQRTSNSPSLDPPPICLTAQFPAVELAKAGESFFEFSSRLEFLKGACGLSLFYSMRGHHIGPIFRPDDRIPPPISSNPEYRVEVPKLALNSKKTVF
jgi:hypothetical protein